MWFFQRLLALTVYFMSAVLMLVSWHHCSFQGDDGDVTKVTVCKNECFLRLGMTLKYIFLLGHQLLLVDGWHSCVEPKAMPNGQCLRVWVCVTKRPLSWKPHCRKPGVPDHRRACFLVVLALDTGLFVDEYSTDVCLAFSVSHLFYMTL